MLKRILVGLDGSDYTAAATGHALELARTHGANVSGVAVVDTAEIAQHEVGAGLGAAYYAAHLRMVLTHEWVERTAGYVKAFVAEAAKAGVQHKASSESGVPFQAIIEEALYHDLIVVGLKTWFHGPGKEEHGRRDTLRRLTQNAIRPVLAVPRSRRPVQRVLAAVSTGPASARAFHSFLQVRPWQGAGLLLLHMAKDPVKGRFVLDAHAEYALAHGVATESVLLPEEDTGTAILRETAARKCDAIVMGAHDSPGLSDVLFGSNTMQVVDNAQVPVFLHG